MNAHRGTLTDDLCDLLINMKLQEGPMECLHAIITGEQDVSMDYTPTAPALIEPTYHGCAYLQAIQAQADAYQTTNGEYLEAIFTHREILSAYPIAHRSCAHGLLALASLLEQRAWRADRDEDAEAVSAFRHEAQVVSAATM